MGYRPHLALVTGGSRGIGSVISERLRNSGYEVLIPSRGELDLANIESIKKYISQNRNQPISVLINNAGINFPAPIDQIALEQWQSTLQVNLTAPFMLIQGLTNHMKEQRFGRIVNLSSIFSLVTRENRAAYSAAKSGLNGLTRTTAVEFGPFNILVNSVCPGYIDTELTRQNNSPEQLKTIVGSIPLGRMADAAEIAELVDFLVSEKNSYITGHTLVADGGFTCK